MKKLKTEIHIKYVLGRILSVNVDKNTNTVKSDDLIKVIDSIIKEYGFNKKDKVIKKYTNPTNVGIKNKGGLD